MDLHAWVRYQRHPRISGPLHLHHPCGLTGVEITCFEREAGVEIDMTDCIRCAARLFEAALETLVEPQTL